MKICAVQTRPVKGDIQQNIDHHKKLIALAVANGASIVIFPELSVTGYEPELAKTLATTPDDSRFDDFQTISDASQVIIGIGAPIKNNNGICIGMIIFHPHQARQVYSKKYLHADEEPFFISGINTATLINNTRIAPAICYELSIPEHAENAFKNNANIYIASVAKTADGIAKAIDQLSAIAINYSMTVVLSNCVGHCDNFESAGNSSAWNSKGVLTGLLNDTDEGILIIDTETDEVTKKLLLQQVI